MLYLSIDVRTTGDDPDTCQVVEFAAILDNDRAVAVEDLPAFHAYVNHAFVRGTPAKLLEQAGALAVLADPKAAGVVPVGNLFDEFHAWLLGANGNVEYPFPVAGRNFASFSAKFLLRIPGRWPDVLSDKVLDPAILYLEPSDSSLPDLDKCLSAAGVASFSSPSTAPPALASARDMVKVVRFKL